MIIVFLPLFIKNAIVINNISHNEIILDFKSDLQDKN